MSEIIKMLTVRIPRKLKTDFKIWCEKHHTDMSKEIIRMIKELIGK